MVRMLIFLAAFLAVYIGMHLLVRWGVQPLLAGHPLAARGLTLLMALLIPTPLLVRGLERLGWEGPARLLAAVGYLWMGIIFLVFAGFALLALWELLVRGASFLAPAVAGASLHGARTALTILGVGLLTAGYGLWEARALRVEQVVLHSPRLPEGRERLRIVQISDLHLGLLLRQATIDRVMTEVEALHPDLLVVTGDLVDAQIDHLEDLGARLAALHPPLGKYAVTGNHEYYAGLPQALAFMRGCGLTVLRGSSVTPVPGLVIAGVDDPTGGTVDEAALLANAGNAFTVLLKHRPLVAEEAAGRFDLQLSGHAHRGQIVPFNLLTGLAFPLQDGLTRLQQRGWLYTSRGTGTWGPPLRVGSPPEVTLIEVLRSPAPGATAHGRTP